GQLEPGSEARAGSADPACALERHVIGHAKAAAKEVDLEFAGVQRHASPRWAQPTGHAWIRSRLTRPAAKFQNNVLPTSTALDSAGGFFRDMGDFPRAIA